MIEIEEAGAGSRRERIARGRERVLARLGPSFRLRRAFAEVPGFSGTLGSEGLALVEAEPGVRSVRLDRAGRGALAESVPALHASQVHAVLQRRGQGLTVAVLDSGVDATHPDLEGQVVAQHCFTSAACPPGASNEGELAPDVAGHGTSVAAVVASRGGAPGFAPDARLVSVRVLDDDARGFTSDWIAGLDWLLGHPELGVRIVNMSLGSDQLYGSSCETDYPLALSAVTQLRGAGVSLFASSGNDGSSTQSAFPSCLPGVTGVGATYDADLGREPDFGSYEDAFGPAFGACFDASSSLDTFACFTNAGPGLRLLAPGTLITTAAPGGGYETWSGTSQASPTVAGVAALVLEERPDLSPDAIVEILAKTGIPVDDPRTGETYPRIDALAALRAATCAGKADDVACDDGATCTTNDACLAESCAGEPAPDGSPCDDGSGPGECVAAACVPGQASSGVGGGGALPRTRPLDPDPGGCSCDVPAARRPPEAWLVALVAFGLGLARRRRVRG